MNLKKQLILNCPYMLFGLYATKLGYAWRLAEGADASQKLIHYLDALETAMQSPWPSFHPADLLVGIAAGAVLWMVRYVKKQNAKKYRQGKEYGSARWGGPEDIKPFIDPIFRNNVILTQTERLTIPSKVPNPAYARNKNVLVVGGSGSGKTRFFLKPNLMQLHSSYVVTDPKGQNLVSCPCAGRS